MNPAASRLAGRVLALEFLASALVALVLAGVGPRFVLLRGVVGLAASRGLGVAAAAGFVFALGHAALRLRRHRFVLRALAVGSDAIEPYELRELEEEPWRLVGAWALSTLPPLLLSATLLRPELVDATTGVTLALLGATVVAAVALPLYVVIRGRVLSALELAPVAVLREVVEGAARSGLPETRLARRIAAAVVVPVAFLALGSALIVNAHVRRSDERHREETARMIARAAFEPASGVLPMAGLREAVERARALGYDARLDRTPHPHAVERRAAGVVELKTPLDAGHAAVRFSGSTVGLLGTQALLVALVAVALAALAGTRLARSVVRDLARAVADVRRLGTDAVVAGQASVAGSARFEVVEALRRAIVALADRFRVFALAQERAIEAREATTRTRGLFFASVSHDLKSPLNSILGFADLVQASEPLEPAQRESLELILRRGRELLVLIETILDAARVEAGQLALERRPLGVLELLEAAVGRGRLLGGDGVPELVVDARGAAGTRCSADLERLAGALASLVGFALRVSRRGPVRLSAAAVGARLRFEITMPTRRNSARALEELLQGQHPAATTAHRGLVLGLGLARSIVEAHGGGVRPVQVADGTTLFRVELGLSDPG